ncbi:glycosyltransferase involved in cell wall biosynthesis [Cryobacterium mesophilum]|uniref:Glycosyltransferase family 1 protein n=1 Tax=Terrimesophilobacter mesophilus TaxID=433647 RepID=A0A4R8VCD1_9MICO|nr:glycosyltransferase family 1 protein [Terrimesophilobacter mesophilus]MBB5632679.1 glycosyltransferase involved in cell wall biosynthesis [Terrimesophilobacter mesophilus]TFB79487.1 glycosyltransferase family 1 protein [Terrimesophilobacter mesophilus]
MTTLSVIVDPIVDPASSGIRRYTEELTRELIHVAPPNCDVVGLVAAMTPEQDEQLRLLLPGLAEIRPSRWSRTALTSAWRFGLGGINGRGMVHSTSLVAPLSRHDRMNYESDQIVVTIHDVIPWTNPETLSRNRVSLHKAMTRRAHRFADAVVVPSHAVAARLGELYDFGDRIRVIGGAVSPKLQVPVDAETRAQRLGLPEKYLLSVGTLEPRKGLTALIRSLAEPDAVDLPLLIVGPDGWGGVDVNAIAAEAGLPEGRVRTLGFLPDADLAVALDRATVFVFPSIAEGFGLPVVEALHFGTPVVHSDDPAVVEVAADAGIAVALEDAEGYPRRLAEAIASVVNDPSLAERLHYKGLDRAGAFSWRDAAERVWQLHADL